MEWLKSEEDNQSETDEIIEYENAKRHISLKRDHEDTLYNFTSNITWENIVQIYNNEIKPKDKLHNSPESSNLDFIDSNNNINENSIDLDSFSLGKR